MRKRLFLFILAFFMLFMSGCDLINGNKENNDEPVDSLYEVYKLAAANGYEGSYEDWIESIRGENGKTIELVVDNNYLCYKYTGDSILVPIYDLSKLMGAPGEQGAPGIQGVDGVSITKVEKTATDGLVDTYTITFSNGTTTTYTINNGATGAQGEQGVSITKVEKTATDGLTDTYTITFSNGTTTTYTINNGATGLSAYEIYVKEHPDYTKTKEEWMDDLVNGRLLKKDTLTVQFVTNCDDVIENIEVNKGEKITKPNDPTKEEAEFLGWYYDDQQWIFICYTATEDMTLVAKWKINQYTLTLKLNNGADDIVLTQDFGSNINVVDPIRPGYTLEWSEPIQTTMPNEDKTIEANWTCDFKYKVNDNKITITGLKNTSLTDIVIPNEIENKEVTKIEMNAFCACSEITSITIPDSVTNIGANAFERCTSLASIAIPNSVTEIGYTLFGNCVSLTNVEIPSSVTYINKYAFCGCRALTNITLPDSVTSIDSSAFDNCVSLVDFTIPNSVTSIGDFAFSGCSSLKTATIPANLTNIGRNIFYNCAALTSIVVDENNQRYDSRDDSNAIIDTLSNRMIAACPNTIIPDSVTSLGDYVFYCCKTLKSITIPNSVTSIGAEAFHDCTSLESITIPNSVTYIGDFAFYSCTSIETITLPNSVTRIGRYAFYGCTALTINCEAESKPEGWDSTWNLGDCPVVWGYTE